MSDFDAEWEAAKAGELPPPPEGFFDDGAPDLPPPGVEEPKTEEPKTEFGKLIRRGKAPKPDTSMEMRPALTSAFKAVQERAEKGGGLAGAECGLTRIDSVLDGWQLGRFYVIGGRTGMGKSVVGLNIAMGLASRGHGVDFLSLEMPTEEQAMRALLCQAGVPHHRIKNGTVRQEDWKAMTAAVDGMCRWPWIWDDQGGVTVEWIAEHTAKTRERLREKGMILHTVVIDHVQKIRGSEPRSPRHEQMKWIVDGLKQLAKRENLCVIALAQINRSTEQRTVKDHRPRMADLREAGAVEEEADAVGLLYRADYYETEKQNHTNVLELNFAKVRGGEPKVVRLRFDGARSRIDNLEYEDEDTNA